MKKLVSKSVFLVLSISWILTNSFSQSGLKPYYHQIHSTDTIKRSSTILDDALYSGYLENFEPIKSLIMNPKRIDSLLKTPLPKCYVLTKEDMTNFLLSIDQNKVAQPGDTLVFGKKCLVTYLPLKLTNQSTDTLKYVTMNCSWLDIYFTNNKSFKFIKQICYKNSVSVNTVLSNHSKTIYIPLLVNNRNHNGKIRIGMSLQKFVGGTLDLNYDPFVLMLRPETINLIWSNEIELP